MSYSMPNAKITANGNEIPVSSSLLTAGRSSDNDIAFPNDSNVSRYHAEIENRHGDYWLIDLGSSNGTTVNGIKVDGEIRLNNGDKVLLGGSSEFVFKNGDEKEKEEAAAESASAEVPVGTPNISAPPVEQGTLVERETAVASKPSSTILIAGGICGLAVVCLVAAAVFYAMKGSKCDARATITKPEPGDTISQPVDIEVDAENTGCVASAVFTLGGVEFATVQNEPYTAKLDPKDHPDLSDGFEHQLAITLIDGNGEKIPQSQPIALAFETREVTKPSPTPEIVQGNTQQQQGGKKTGNVSLLEVQQMSQNLVKQLGGNTQYNISNKQFLQAIQQKTAEYAHEGYFQRASVYRDKINVAYFQERNLPAALGFILAMSRSQFNPAKQGNEEGLWRMTNDFATANGYLGLCGTETLSDVSQSCAATASALYMKAIYYDVFDQDVLYSAAAFGKSPADAGAWKASLPQNRSDIWNSIKTAPEREQIVRFFAAGIVAENPQRFGLTNDQPLSVLYKVTM